MQSMLMCPPVGFDDLSIEEQIDYVQSLWERIVMKNDRESVPVPAWHRRVLEARLTEFEANPEAGRPWEEVEADLLEGLSKV